MSEITEEQLREATREKTFAAGVFDELVFVRIPAEDSEEWDIEAHEVAADIEVEFPSLDFDAVEEDSNSHREVWFERK